MQSPGHAGVTIPPRPPSATKKTLSNDDMLRLFISAMLKEFPDHDLMYCFKSGQFNNPKTNDMFKIWKIGKTHA